MLCPDDRLCPNDKDVAAKVMDGEAILINLTNGLYYSMDGVGGWVWAAIEQRRSLRQIVASLMQRYDVPSARAEAEVLELAEQLLKEELVRVASDAAPPVEESEPDPPQKLPYETPRLQTYRDMADLLSLDPPMPGLTDIPWKGPSA